MSHPVKRTIWEKTHFWDGTIARCVPIASHSKMMLSRTEAVWSVGRFCAMMTSGLLVYSKFHTMADISVEVGKISMMKVFQGISSHKNGMPASVSMWVIDYIFTQHFFLNPPKKSVIEWIFGTQLGRYCRNPCSTFHQVRDSKFLS